jgi:diguanylate cyclase
MHDYVSTQEIVRQLIPFLAKKEIPLTPENYRLWFEYFLGKKEEIRKRLDQLLQSDAVFNSELNDSLYTEFFVRDLHKESAEKVQAEIDAAEKLGGKISDMVVSLMKDILAGIDSTSGYGEKLTKYQASMKSVSGIDDIRNVITEILQETQKVTAESSKIHKKLEKSSEDLDTLQTKLLKAKNEARTDNLTKLWNRRFFDEHLQSSINAVEKGREYSLIFIDVDHFKKFNDAFGHVIGDKLLMHIASEMRKHARQNAHVCRYGGEEFGIICMDSDLDRAATLAETIRKEVKSVDFTIRGKKADVTVSAGVTVIRPGDSPKNVVERADTALYLAKNSGRDNVKTENDAKSAAKIAKN